MNSRVVALQNALADGLFPMASLPPQKRTDMLDYPDLNEILARAEADPGASGYHGFLCGQLCASPVVHDSDWMEFLDARSSETAAVSQCHVECRQLLRDVEAQIWSPTFSFRLMLPGDETPIAERLGALSEWCHGFLSGFGLAGGAGGSGTQLDEEAREWLGDVAMIARVDPGVAGSGTDESAYFEVTEYVRAGVMSLAEDTRPGDGGTQTEEVLH